MLPKTKILIIVLTLLLAGCQQRNRFHMANFEHPVEVKVNRFDLNFIALDTADVVCGLIALEQNYPAFYPVFLSDVLMMHEEDTIENATQIKQFLQDTTFLNVHQQVKVTFSDTKQIEKQLSTAFSYLSHYFPDVQLPEIYFFVSGFNHQFVLNDSIIGIGSDLYLGADFELYRDITYEYLIPNMRKEMLVSDLLKILLHNTFSFNADVNVLNTMLYEGKMLYLLGILMPEASPELIIGYSKEELNWCKKHEKQIWTSMLEKRHLYSTDYMLINQYINAAPFTSPVSTESPGKLGAWIGWQIVQKYMQNNKVVNLQELMSNQHYQSILEQSLYRP